jgi:hypothetical protein
VDFVIKLFIALQKTLKSFSRFSYWDKGRIAEEPLVNPWKRQEILPLCQNTQVFSETNTDSHTKHSELKAGHLSISHRGKRMSGALPPFSHMSNKRS